LNYYFYFKICCENPLARIETTSHHFSSATRFFLRPRFCRLKPFALCGGQKDLMPPKAQGPFGKKLVFRAGGD